MGVGLMAASVGMQAYGGIQSAKSAKAWGSYQKKQAQADALAEIGAAEVEAGYIREQAGRERSAATNAVATNGLVVGDGTAEVIEKDIIARGEHDAQMTIYNGQAAANRILAEGSAAKERGKQEAKAAYIGTAGSIFGTISSYNMWNKSASAPVDDRSISRPKSQAIINKPGRGFGFY